MLAFFNCYTILLTVISCSLSYSFLRSPVAAQIVSDDTLHSKVSLTGNNQSIITGGIQAGNNLFHSFSHFSVASDQTAYFDNNLGIQNIFSRITGGEVSNLNGLIKANGNASLFLINPAGIIFGANAQLNLGGSFIATTADTLIFADRTEFQTTLGRTKPILTVSFPIGLQYGTNPQPIISRNSNQNQSTNLTVKPGNTLALLGGSIWLENTLINNLQGRIEIGSVSKNQLITINRDRQGWIVDYSLAKKFAQINLNKQSLIQSANGGIIQIQGQEISLEDSVILNLTTEQNNGGNTNLIASDLIDLNNSFISTQVGQNFGFDILGKGGDIFIQANQIKLNNGSGISAETLSSGNSGNLKIEATELIEISGKNNFVASFMSTSTAGKGTGGEINLNTAKLLLQDGGQVQAASFGQGKAGTIIVNSTKSIDISGTDINNQGRVFKSGFFASAGIENVSFELQPSGKSGNLIINTPNLMIEKEGQISVSNFGQENAGNINLNVGNLSLMSLGEIIANNASGSGGSIDLTANNITLQSQGKITTTAAKNGDGGNIEISSDNLVLFPQTQINANAQEGSGGNILIKTQGFFLSPTSLITASSNLGTDGAIKIITPDVDSAINTISIEQSPLKAEDLIYTGCGLGGNFAEDQFRYIGRGGLPPNPMIGTAVENSLADFGSTKLSSTVHQFKFDQQTIKAMPLFEPIVEASNWVINKKGNVELVTNNSVSSNLLSISCQLK